MIIIFLTWDQRNKLNYSQLLQNLVNDHKIPAIKKADNKIRIYTKEKIQQD